MVFLLYQLFRFTLDRGGGGRTEVVTETESFCFAGVLVEFQPFDTRQRGRKTSAHEVLTRIPARVPLRQRSTLVAPLSHHCRPNKTVSAHRHSPNRGKKRTMGYWRQRRSLWCGGVLGYCGICLAGLVRLGVAVGGDCASYWAVRRRRETMRRMGRSEQLQVERRDGRSCPARSFI